MANGIAFLVLLVLLVLFVRSLFYCRTNLCHRCA